MLDTIDAAVFDRGRAWFFGGARFVEWAPGRGVVASGRLGVDGWRELPEELHAGVDAAVHVDGTTYLMRGPHCVASGERALRRIDRRWSLPPAFRDGIDAAVHDRVRGRTLFVRGRELVEAETGAVAALAEPVDALLDYGGRIYAFRGRDYARWDPETRAWLGVRRRIGAPYGRGLPDGKGGGWPGLSHLLAGPTLGPVTATTATLWLWALDRAVLGRLAVRGHRHELRELPGGDRAYPDSAIATLTIAGLEPARAYELELVLDERVLDRVEVRTVAAPADRGEVTFVVGSCADTSALRDVPAYDRMAAHRADAALLVGDNLYYVNRFGSSSDSVWKGGFLRADWDDPRRMLLRQLAARNHPQLATLARTTSLYATWDDHDFGYNNAGGHDRTRWAGREASAAIQRAMWAGPYVAAGAIYQRFRAGPVEVLVTDNRYDKDTRAREMLGAAQLAWLAGALAASDAPLVVLVVASQLLYRRRSESFPIDAPGERAALLDAIGRARGRVLVVSGDVHYSELARLPATGPARVLELTSSGLRTGEHEELVEWAPGVRVWIAQGDAYAVIRADVRGWHDGTVTVEARDDRGELLVDRRPDGDRPCRTVWNLADGTLA